MRKQATFWFQKMEPDNGSKSPWYFLILIINLKYGIVNIVESTTGKKNKSLAEGKAKISDNTLSNIECNSQ